MKPRTRTSLKIAALPVALVAGWVAIDQGTKQLDQNLRAAASAEAGEICCVIARNEIITNKILCRIDRYTAYYAEEESQCPDGLFYRSINRIRGCIGDTNEDAQVGLTDYADFVTCLESPLPLPANCVCPFDYDCDKDLDLKDFAGFQYAFGSGITFYERGGEQY